MNTETILVLVFFGLFVVQPPMRSDSSWLPALIPSISSKSRDTRGSFGLAEPRLNGATPSAAAATLFVWLRSGTMNSPVDCSTCF